MHGFGVMAHRMFQDPSVTWQIRGNVRLYATAAGITLDLGKYGLVKSMALAGPHSCVLIYANAARGSVVRCCGAGNCALFNLTCTWDPPRVCAGCDGFKNAVMESFNVYNSSSGSVHISVVMAVVNPSIFTINPLGDVSVLVYYTSDEGTTAIGPPATVLSMAIQPGLNRYGVASRARALRSSAPLPRFVQRICLVSPWLQAGRHRRVRSWQHDHRRLTDREVLEPPAV